MAQVTCPSCGGAVEVPEKKSKAPWLIGCLVAAAVIPVILGVVGLLAAIAIPSFIKARNTAQMNGCINNMRMIDAGKEQWALAGVLKPGGLPIYQV
jgi:competence protein ComGC